MKNRNRYLTGFLLPALGLFLSVPGFTQLNVVSNSNASALAAKLVGSGVTITNATLNCPTGAAGTFATGPGINEVGIREGVLLTSGNVSIAASPNNSPNATVNNGAPGNPVLTALIPTFTTFDACMLEFDLEAIGNQVSFEYVFASEEYEEYYCTQFNDVFGFFVTGPKPGAGNYTDHNIAIVPGTASTPVSINNVGPSSCAGIDNHALYQNMSGAATLQYDGKTKVLLAKIDLKPCKKYRFKLGVADAGDRVLDSGVFLKEGSFVSTPPVIVCPTPVNLDNEPGKCSAVANYMPTVSADCPVTATCTPPSGTTFPVGTTTVTCKATDQLGNTATCTFTVTVKDVEKPSASCPASVTVSCEASTLPNAVGFPLVTDNCGVSPSTYTDAIVAGSCTHDFTINRTWTAHDIHGNTNTCLHVIKVEDKKSPVITCPVNITVTCDTSAAATGLATAMDNCDPAPELSRNDVHAAGFCEWYCIVERHFTAKDDCRNAATCVQIITKNVAPLIETVLPLTVGVSNSTVTIPTGKANCVVQWLPASGTVPKGLVFKNFTVGADCLPGTNPTDPDGRLVNPLFGEALKLNILAKLKPALGTKKLNTFSCTIPPVIVHYLAPNPDVNELLRVTNTALGNISVQPHLNELLGVLQCINSGLNICD